MSINKYLNYFSYSFDVEQQFENPFFNLNNKILAKIPNQITKTNLSS